MTVAQQILDLISKTESRSDQQKVFTEKEHQTVYIAAYQFYQIGEYTKACELFVQLTQSQPLNAAAWKGLASCYQMLSLWDVALNAWAFCSLLEETDAAPHYYAAECLHAQKQHQEAKKALTKARSLCQGPKGASLLQKINLLEEFCTT